uniref:BZIP domain-containing protein n=1 Tax=Fusarium oxysporum (strain Fo5176) TaxID=660025 RepID=A0A0C4BKZ9_FUSOF
MSADAESNRWQLPFEQAIDTCTVTMRAGLGPSYIPLPPQPMKFGNLEGNGALKNIRQSAIDDKKLNRRAHTRRQSQAAANEALSESSAYGQAAQSPEPRKRGRKPNKQSKEQQVAGQQVELGDDDLPKDPRRRRVLERNRIAANKCRLRKRGEASALACHEKAMEDQNRHLTANALRPCDGSPSDASTAQELNTQSLNGGRFLSTPRISSQQGSIASDVTDIVFDMMDLGPFQMATMLPDSMAFTQPVPPLSFTEYGPELSVYEGPREHQADEVAWGSYWQF